MATVITSECINCGACEPECPNTAIYGGGVAWELNGQVSPAIAQDIYYIVPSKCTECVGFHDHEACAAVCPVDCCVPDPNIPETPDVLLDAPAHCIPSCTIPDDAPSRLQQGTERHMPRRRPFPPRGRWRPQTRYQWRRACCPRSRPQLLPKTRCCSRASPRHARRWHAPAAMMNLPKDIGTLPGPIGEKHFPGELAEDFDAVLATVDLAEVKSAPIPVRIDAGLAEPILGAYAGRIKTQPRKRGG